MALAAERSLKLPVCTQEKCNKMLVGIGDYFEGGRGKIEPQTMLNDKKWPT